MDPHRFSSLHHPRTLVDFLKLAEQVDVLRTGRERKVRAALVSGFTVDALADVMRAEGFLHGLDLAVYTAPYAQFRQEILNAGSGLYAFDPDIVFLLFDFSDFFGDAEFSHHTSSSPEHAERLREALDRYRELVQTLADQSRATIVAATLPLPTFRPLTILDNKHEVGLSRTLSCINHSLEDLFSANPRVFVFDFDRWLGAVGKNGSWKSKFYFIGDLKLEPEQFPALARNLVAYAIAVASATRKCIVLDLDDTLWGGVVGEEGINGIHLAPTGSGQPFYYFQKHLLALHHRGVMLTINSKNNEEDVWEVIRNHPHMLLREPHFAAWRINWNDKVANMKELAEELGIGLDAMVFIDDDPVNIALVNEFLPEVATITAPRDAAQLHRALVDYPGFGSFAFTDEDRARGAMYAAERKRRDLHAQATNLDEFLKSLELRVVVRPLDGFSLPRAAQLTQKTNQFNLTTRRYTEEALSGMLARGSRALVVDVSDRFGESGITGLAIAHPTAESWLIDTFLLSCRVLGKGVERALLASVIDDAKRAGAAKVVGEFIPTKKNAPCASFYRDVGFACVREDAGGAAYEFDLTRDFVAPPFITVLREGPRGGMA